MLFKIALNQSNYKISVNLLGWNYFRIFFIRLAPKHTLLALSGIDNEYLNCFSAEITKKSLFDYRYTLIWIGALIILWVYVFAMCRCHKPCFSLISLVYCTVNPHYNVSICSQRCCH